MPVNDLTVERLSPALGATVRGIDLGQPLNDMMAAAIHELIQEYHLLCFPDQHLTPDAQVAFSEALGPLEVFPEKDKTKAETTIYNVANVSPEGEHLAPNDHRVIYQKVNARWHTDSSYRYTPSYVSIMYGVEVLPDGAEGGETEFSNMLLAYDALPDAMKRRLEPLHMVHYYEFGRRLFPELPPITPEEREEVPPVAHPLIRVHPDRAGRRSLYMTTNAGNEISGLTLEDGRALHRELAEHVSQPEFCYRHRWAVNDLVLWDNRCLLHRARPYDMAKYRRAFRRTTVAGNGPVVGPYSAAAAAE